jgi:hypothetical protein
LASSIIYARYIKTHGIFRQGLQWTTEELEFYEVTQLRKERLRLEREGLVQDSITDFDPLAEVEEPPPTFRGEDERRRAEYQQLMFSMGRLQNFKRVTGVEEERLDMISDRSAYSIVLTHLHKDAFNFDWELTGIEEDLDQTGNFLATYEKMKSLWMRATQNLNMDIQEKIKSDKEKLKCQLKFSPEVFKAAVPQANQCEHLRAEAWGKSYASGVKCVKCGKELSASHQEESQLVGHGSGTDLWMADAVQRHRANEQSVGFKPSLDLTKVEDERVRLEKERYELASPEQFSFR